MPGPLELVYALREHPARIAKMQKASETDRGLVADPFIGTDDWWLATEDGRLERQLIDAEITWVGWGSMADHPEFRMSHQTDPHESWRRVGDIRRYVDGIAVRLLFVRHPWKLPTPGLGAGSRIVLEVWLESVERRSSGIAPGPNEDGYQRIKGTLGDQVHYLNFPTLASARQVAATISGETVVVTEPTRLHGTWQIEAWEREPRPNKAQIWRLMDLAHENGGRYDGGETVGGEPWGPNIGAGLEKV